MLALGHKSKPQNHYVWTYFICNQPTHSITLSYITSFTSIFSSPFLFSSLNSRTMNLCLNYSHLLLGFAHWELLFSIPQFSTLNKVSEDPGTSPHPRICISNVHHQVHFEDVQIPLLNTQRFWVRNFGAGPRNLYFLKLRFLRIRQILFVLRHHAMHLTLSVIFRSGLSSLCHLPKLLPPLN